MRWEVEFTDEFETWWDLLDLDEQDAIDVAVHLLEQKGPSLPFPFGSGIASSRYSHMRELRIQQAGRPYRILYAFDPRRVAILLCGGMKEGDDRWYRRFVPKADALYARHLELIAEEGLLHDE